ncbi:hypothetical protein [Halocatena pleomorpha]|uniref:Uncharacterized protein n=1 Tax=Halocatena pleomorpha TaxID=1785090 RepID=A0A3P3R7R0_9EURY|nr:hypothetical protein [Halocatena pleomorpha]RRJ29501.1 hypothetical protein EIK79_12755 [Halocatena pleomorpha]
MTAISLTDTRRERVGGGVIRRPPAIEGEADSLAKVTGELVCLNVPEGEATVAVHTSHGQKVSQPLSVGT